MRSSQSPVIATGDSLVESAAIRKPDLSALPRVFILATHLSEAELHQAEDSLVDRGASLTYDIKEANLVLGNISTERRARIELKWGKVKTEEFSPEQKHTGSALLNDSKIESHAPKRQRLNGKGRFFVAKPSEPSEPNKKNDGTTTSTTDSTTDSTLDDDKKSDTAQLVSQNPIQGVSSSPTICSLNSDEVEEAISLKSDFDSSSLKIKVLKITWLYDTIHAEEIQPFEPYTIYEAALVRSDGGVTSPIQDKLQSETTSIKKTNRSSLQEQEAQQIIERAKLDAKAVVRPKFSRTRKRDHVKEAADQDFKGRSFASSTKTEDQRFGRTVSQPPRLLHQTTSEHDEDFGSSTPPKLPDWVKEKRLYSCERATPPNSPNNEFIAQLEQIRLARTLTGDDTGVRAYSTSIASLAAYPYPLSSKREILALPGCEQKIAALFHEWRTSGKLQAVSDIDADPILQVLRVFYEIWGVGATLAREFYYDRHWRDLDDVIEQGWRSLTRVQQ